MTTYKVRSKKQMLATIKHLNGKVPSSKIELVGTNFSLELAPTPTDRWHTKLINRIKQTPQSMWDKGGQ